MKRIDLAERAMILGALANVVEPEEAYKRFGDLKIRTMIEIADTMSEQFGPDEQEEIMFNMFEIMLDEFIEDALPVYGTSSYGKKEVVH